MNRLLVTTLRAPPPTCYLSLHDALPIFAWPIRHRRGDRVAGRDRDGAGRADPVHDDGRRRRHDGERGAGEQAVAARREEPRSEEHTSELQSLRHLVCRLLLEKKKITRIR